MIGQPIRFFLRLLIFTQFLEISSIRFDMLDISMGSQSWCTKVISDRDEIFSVCRAFNSKNFDKKSFSKTCYFHEDILKILLSMKNQKP